MNQASKVIVLIKIIIACDFGFSLFRIVTNVIAVALNIIIIDVIRVPLRKENIYILIVDVFI